jgi:hypothetical protein
MVTAAHTLRVAPKRGRFHCGLGTGSAMARPSSSSRSPVLGPAAAAASAGACTQVGSRGRRQHAGRRRRAHRSTQQRRAQHTRGPKATHTHAPAAPPSPTPPRTQSTPPPHLWRVGAAPGLQRHVLSVVVVACSKRRAREPQPSERACDPHHLHTPRIHIRLGVSWSRTRPARVPCGPQQAGGSARRQASSPARAHQE